MKYKFSISLLGTGIICIIIGGFQTFANSFYAPVGIILIVLGLIGIIYRIIKTYGTDYETREKKKESKLEKRTCPSCLTALEMDLLICPNCGKKI